MRPLEIVLIIMLILCWGRYVLPVSRRPHWLMLLPGITVVIAIAQRTVEHYRWQMVPAYSLALAFLLLSLWRLWRKHPDTPVRLHRRIVNGIGIVLGFGLLIIATVLPALVPVFQLLNPTGQYAVGTTSFVFTDNSRSEIFTPDPEDKRLVYVQVWYPAESTADSTRMPLWIDPEKITAAIAKDFNVPEFLFSHFTLLESNSYLDAPLAEQETPYPVLVFSHGYSPGFFAQNMVQMEELASHGYIVFSVGHTYESALVFDTQGRAIMANEEQTAAFYRENTQTNENGQFAKVYYSVGEEQEKASREMVDAGPIQQKSFLIWAQDVQFVVTQIELMNSGKVDSRFKGNLDTSRIGVFGQSFGGAVAFQVCALEKRCKAALNMDGTQWGTLSDNPLQTPFMMMYNPAQDNTNDWVFSNSPAHGYKIRVNGSSHVNFTDFNLVSPVLFKSNFMGLLGEIDTNKMEQLMNAYILAFFNETLKEIPSPLLEGININYIEAEIRIYR